MDSSRVEPVIDQPDFKVYPSERLQTEFGPVTGQLCAERNCGRWEYFYSFIDDEVEAILDDILDSKI